MYCLFLNFLCEKSDSMIATSSLVRDTNLLRFLMRDSRIFAILTGKIRKSLHTRRDGLLTDVNCFLSGNIGRTSRKQPENTVVFNLKVHLNSAWRGGVHE